MLETKVTPADRNLSYTLDRLIFFKKLIELGDTPKIPEEELKLFATAVDMYHQLPPTHWIRRSYPNTLEVYKGVKEYYNDRQIDYAMEALTDMCHRHELLKEGKKPRFEENEVNEIGVLLEKFRQWILIHRPNDIVYRLALEALGIKYAEILNYTKQGKGTIITKPEHQSA